MISARLRVRKFACTSVVAACVTGCHVDLSGLSDLLDPTATYLNLPGRRVASGQFHAVDTDGTDKGGAYVLALEDYSGGTRTAIFPFAGGAGCRMGATTSGPKALFFAGSPRSELPLFVPYLNKELIGPEGIVTSSNPQTGLPTSTANVLHLAGPDCEEPLSPVVSGFPLSPLGVDDPPGFLTFTGSLPACPAPTAGAASPPCEGNPFRNLMFLEPWAKKQTQVAANVTRTQLIDEKIWTVEAAPSGAPPNTAGVVPTSQLVVRDLSFKELARFGTNVSEFAVTTQALTRAVFVDQVLEPIDSSDPSSRKTHKGHVFSVTDRFETPVQIDSDGCNVAFPGGYRGLGVTYLSPCASHQLVAYGSHLVSDGGPGKNDKKYVLGSNPIGPPAFFVSGDQIFAFFAAGRAIPVSPPTFWDSSAFELKPTAVSAAHAALMGGTVGAPFERLGVSPQVDRSNTPIISPQGDEWQTLVSLQKTYAIGPTDISVPPLSLVRWKPGEAVRELAKKVAQVSESFAIVNYDGTGGDLVTIEDDGVSAPYLTGVPGDGLLSDTTGNGIGTTPLGVIALADYDGTSGTLYASNASPLHFDEVATKVSNNAFGFNAVVNINGVGYLHDYDPATNTGLLGVQVIATGDTFETGIRVSEWSEVGWPQPGLLYVIPSGKEQGIWFAALK